MSIIDNCVGDDDDYIIDLCENDKIAGSDAIALIKQGFTFTDPSDPTEWTAGIASQDIVIIRTGSGTFADMSPVMTDNPRASGPAQKLTYMDGTFTFIDPNVYEQNDTFWANKNGRSYHYAWFNFEELEVRTVMDYLCQVVALPANDDRSIGYQRYMITITFKTRPNFKPTRDTAPAGIFQ